jgi:hypothetical protein
MGTVPTSVIKPKVRTITGFVRINADTYKSLISNALVALRKAEAEFEAAGYDVETLRVTTPPMAEFVGGMPQDQALTILQQLNDLSASGHFVLNLGPAMVHDNDAPSTMRLLERALATMPNIESSPIIADRDGVRTRTVR